MSKTKPQDGPKRRRIWFKRFEHKSEPLAAHNTYLLRQVTYVGVALGVVGVGLGIGIVGYRVTEHMAWIDAALNAAMILGGMGPVQELRTHSGKLFAIFYSLFSGVLFLVAVGVMIAPAVHRLLHSLHLEGDSKE
jgi:hypothetical protein